MILAIVAGKRSKCVVAIRILSKFLNPMSQILSFFKPHTIHLSYHTPSLTEMFSGSLLLTPQRPTMCISILVSVQSMQPNHYFPMHARERSDESSVAERGAPDPGFPSWLWAGHTNSGCKTGALGSAHVDPRTRFTTTALQIHEAASQHATSFWQRIKEGNTTVSLKDIFQDTLFKNSD